MESQDESEEDPDCIFWDTVNGDVCSDTGMLLDGATRAIYGPMMLHDSNERPERMSLDKDMDSGSDSDLESDLEHLERLQEIAQPRNLCETAIADDNKFLDRLLDNRNVYSYRSKCGDNDDVYDVGKLSFCKEFEEARLASATARNGRPIRYVNAVQSSISDGIINGIGVSELCGSRDVINISAIHPKYRKNRWAGLAPIGVKPTVSMLQKEELAKKWHIGLKTAER